MNRIQELFRRKKENILSIFFTAGFPKLDSTIGIARQLEKSGVDLIEIGIPFSDPIADGPTIQESNKQALENGMTLSLLLQQVKEIRKEVSIPIILMGYLNPVLQYGLQKFCSDATASGADGLILPDLPLNEYKSEYESVIRSANLSYSFLISPTTSEERIRQIDAVSTGFIYAVSSSSTTGAKNEFTPEQERYFERLQQLKLKNPFLIGFGVSSQPTFSKACKYGAGAIVGSAFINHLKSSQSYRTIQAFIETIYPAIKSVG